MKTLFKHLIHLALILLLGCNVQSPSQHFINSKSGKILKVEGDSIKICDYDLCKASKIVDSSFLLNDLKYTFNTSDNAITLNTNSTHTFNYIPMHYSEEAWDSIVINLPYVLDSSSINRQIRLYSNWDITFRGKKYYEKYSCDNLQIRHTFRKALEDEIDLILQGQFILDNQPEEDRILYIEIIKYGRNGPERYSGNYINKYFENIILLLASLDKMIQCKEIW